MFRFVCAIALVASCLPRNGAAAERVWTDTQGRTMRAEFLREVDGDAVFLKDGKLITVPLDRFAEVDREQMKRLAEGMPVDGKPVDGKPADGSRAAGPAEIAAPRDAESGSAETGPLASSDGQFFRELRERQDEARQQQAEFAEENPDSGEAPESNPPDAPAEAEPGPPSLEQSVPSNKPPEISTTTLIKSETLAELRPVLIVALVVIGLFGAVGIIVFVATSVAGSNSARRQRPYR